MSRLGPLRRRFREHHGALTKELSRTPGGFGLGQVPERLAPSATTKVVCGFCSVGCSLDVHLRDGAAVNLSPSPSYPVNRGMACPKGWEALAPLSAPDRATTPMVRGIDGRLDPVSWEEAVRTFVTKAKAIQAAHGPASVAFLSTGQIASEEMALLGSVAKFGMGVVHGDGNTRQCMATSVVSYKQSFGFDAPPYTYADLEASDVIVLIGSNMCIAHPVLWQRVLANPNEPEIIVIDPRRTETAMAATEHVALSPKSDLVLLYGLAHILVREGWVDRNYIDAHTSGFGDFAEHVAAFDPITVAEASGIAPAQLEALAATIHRGERVSFWWTMGVNQSHQGVRTAQAIINLALMTGNMGRPGTGANSITGQCNAMGSRLFSNTTNLLGGRDFTSAADRDEVAAATGIPVDRIPDQPSWAYDQIIEGILSGAIKALWVVATNPAHSWMNQSHLHDVLGRLELLVVQDMYSTTETARRADVLLPAAGWGEKDGTFINSERRVGLIKKVAKAPGEALADFSIFRLVAEAWGCGDLFKEWESPEAVFRILQRLSRGRPCDITGIDGYEMLDERGGVQWPMAEGAATEVETERRLFADGRFFHADGRARFIFDAPTPVWESTSQARPLVLLTGRGSSTEWHTNTRTGKSPLLASMAPDHLFLQISPDDAAARGIEPNTWVEVASSRGTVRARAHVTTTISNGQVFLPMHDSATNRLTSGSVDPHSRQPSYKFSAVEVTTAGKG